MTTQALFVDLPNFYSHLLESSVDEPRLLRDYFLYWFDFDRLSERLTNEFSSVWVFYSGRKFGPRSNRIEDQYLDEYIDRINSLRGVTARDVNIEGKQREKATYQCDECGHEGVAQWESEKGIDASLTVHLFDTADTWDVAYLLSGDADFVPVVTSLRRQGKIVVGAGFPNRSIALVRECYDYLDLVNLFLREDIFAYRIFTENGFARKWLTDDVQPQSNDGAVELTFEWQFDTDEVVIYLTAKGNIDLENRLKQIGYLRNIFPDSVGEWNSLQRMFRLTISNTAWSGVKRRIEKLISSLHGLEKYEALRSGVGFKAKYEFNIETQKYETA